MIQIKRAYETPSKKDGYRILVDRLWPRGRKKTDLRLDEWAKELAPSTELRRQFGHDPKKWKGFQTRYRTELRKTSETRQKLESLARRARRSTVTLVYAARDEEHNEAVVLKGMLEKKA